MPYRNTRFDHNVDLSASLWTGKYDTPIIKPERWTPCELVGFNYARSLRKRRGKGLHFFVDDYQFERIWHNPKKYLAMLQEFECVLAPDFSAYPDWPLAVQLYNHYRKHMLAAWMQEHGIRVYPTICWTDEASFDWCFDGEPARGCVAVSSVGTQMSSYTKAGFKRGYDAMLERLQPETVIFYGSVPKDCGGNIVRIKAFQDKFSEVKPACF